ncbi:hypothetical protein B4U80_03456, partial [Leptotrombidium deliense]
MFSRNSFIVHSPAVSAYIHSMGNYISTKSRSSENIVELHEYLSHT